jgi:hypothetical protein
MRKCKKLGSIVGLIVLGVFLLVTTGNNANATEIWTIEYDGSVLPQDATPPWYKEGSGSATTDGDILSIDTIEAGCVERNFGIADIVDSALGLTVEARIQIGVIGSEGTIPDTAILIGDSEKVYKLVFLEDRIAEMQEPAGSPNWWDLDNYYIIDTISDFHIYRLTLNNGIVNVYVDGVHRLTMTGFLLGMNYVRFGEVRHACGGMNGLSYWDYIKVYTGGAKPPEVPYLDDTMSPTGAVHAYPNLIWPPNNKMVMVSFEGYVVDELSIARDGGGVGVSSAYILVDSKEIILRDDTTDLLGEDGSFSVTTKVKAKKGAVYDVELHAADTESEEDGGPNSGLVDSTHICVPTRKNGGDD